MHPEAYDGARRMIAAAGIDPAADLLGLDLGGADINGTARELLPKVHWVGLDAAPGPGVDIVADACTWIPDRSEYDVVLCTELLEHVEHAERCLATAYLALRPGGHLILTCAATGRRPHGARGALDPVPGEWYANIEPGRLRTALSDLFGGHRCHVEYQPNPGDAYAWARKALV